MIHAVGHVWDQGGQDKIDLLASAYANALREAEALGARTLTMPAISAGTFGFAIGAAADVALRTVIAHLEGETAIERVTFVLRGDALEDFRRRLATL